MPKARHPRAERFVREGLFKHLNDFGEFERRVAALPDEQSRGDAFEVFAEACLATLRQHDAAEVWPLTAVPLDVLRSLALGTSDFGVDGVVKTPLGHFNAYQVKFRTDRTPLTWRELSTFMGLADSRSIHTRILFTNCDELPAVLNERSGFFAIRGSDLDRLTAEEFQAIENWLADAAVHVPKKTPQRHQTEALAALLPALEQHDRVSAIMACGTGKTLVALWIAEHVARELVGRAVPCPPPPANEDVLVHHDGAHGVTRPTTAAKILVLLPSLALVRQTLHEWLRETSLPSLAYLCVCSDPTVKEGLDAIATAQSELDFQVSTDAASVREFLDAPFAGTKIVFSTYQSAREVGKAMKPGEAFDFAVFDEAHKTAGREGRNYAFALDDKNLPIRKRLFMTATPRHYNPLNKNKDGDAQLVFSMDNAETYGQQIYRLPFSKAAKRGIICRYKVVISVITSQQVTNELLSHGEVLVNGDVIRARQVANQIALKEAVAKYGVNKIFTFHSTVASAASFTSGGNEGVAIHLPDFKTLHVNGAMPTAAREREMREFRNCKRGIISNARCLTEGVDVPAVDMVAFLAPRRSRVDIVQATGRAMRLDPANRKTTGYILVPLYLEQATNESVEAAVLRSDFNEVWEVLQSLQEQDEVLSEIIRNMRMERGSTKGFDDSRFREIVDVCGPSISLESLRNAISTACVDLLGVSWDESFGELLAYKDEFKDCDVPFRYPKNRQLGIWVVAQRQAKKFGQLNVRQIKLLTGIGFDWQPQNQWDEMFERLVAFKQKNDHCNVPQKCKDDPDLGLWVNAQRAFKSAGTFRREDRVAKLDAIGFSWRVGGSWEDSFAQLVAYNRDNGHCDVSTTENLKLAYWVHCQRRLKRVEKLPPDKFMRLDGIGFRWIGEKSPDKWDGMYERLKLYHSRFRNSDVPFVWNEDQKLARWVHTQRARKKSNQISAEQVRLLEKLGFVWRHRGWDDRLAEIEAFVAKNGHCKIPLNFPENPKLGRFVKNARRQRDSGTLSADRIAKLDALGFVWASIHKTFS